MPEFKTGTGVIHFEVLNARSNPEAATLTLLHNFMSTGRAAWGAMVDALNDQFRILLPDLPGHGRSVGHPASFHHNSIAEQLAQLMAQVGAADGHLAGCSSGGMIAQLIVHHGMANPATLTLVSTTYSVERSTTGDGARLTPEDFQAGASWMEATARLHDPFHYEGYYKEIVLAGFRRLNGRTAIDLRLEALQSWHLPVCLIHGQRDEFFPETIPQRMAEVLSESELHIIPAQSHALIFQQPWKVSEIMLDFLSRHPRYPSGNQ